MLSHQKRNELALLAWDSEGGKSDFSLGFGKGLSSGSDRCVAKAVVSISLDH